MFKFLNKDFQVMKEDKQYYEACLKRIDNNLKHFYQMLLNQQEWHQTIGVRMGALEEKVEELKKVFGEIEVIDETCIKPELLYKKTKDLKPKPKKKADKLGIKE